MLNFVKLSPLYIEMIMFFFRFVNMMNYIDLVFRYLINLAFSFCHDVLFFLYIIELVLPKFFKRIFVSMFMKDIGL